MDENTKKAIEKAKDIKAKTINEVSNIDEGVIEVNSELNETTETTETTENHGQERRKRK